MMGVTVYKRGDVWWISVSHDRTQERWSLKTKDQKVAREMKRAYERRLAAGEPLRQPRAAESPTFKDFAKSWLERKEGTRRKSTVDGYRVVVAEVGKTWGEVPVIDFTRNHAREIAEALVKGGKGSREPKTVLNQLTYLQSLFSDAAEQLRDDQGRLRILENPFAHKARLVEDLMAVAEAAISDPDWHPQPYSEGEVQSLLAVRMDAADRLKILFGLDAGMRRSEIFALHRADLDLDAQWTWVRRRISRGEVGNPKTRRSLRRVPLTDRLVEAIRAQTREVGLSTAVLFPPRRNRKAPGIGYEDAAKFAVRFNRALAAAELVGGEHPFHRLRHTWVSRLLASGVAPYLVSKWAGHSSTGFTEEHYAEWIPGDLHREQINRPHSLSTISAQQGQGEVE
jgi:integrase